FDLSTHFARGGRACGNWSDFRNCLRAGSREADGKASVWCEAMGRLDSDARCRRAFSLGSAGVLCPRAPRREGRSHSDVARRVRKELMHGLLHDLRYALRQLRKSPRFTAVAVITLALGVGANTAIFSVVNAVLLRPLPYPGADRLVMVWEQNPHRGWFENIVSGANFRDWQKQNRVFTDIAAFESNSFSLNGENNTEEVAGERVTANLFSVLGVQPLRGRLFLPEEETQDRAAVILSYGLWQQRYGGDPALIGRHITLNGKGYPVVGILPPSFSDDYSASFAPHSLLWISGIE